MPESSSPTILHIAQTSSTNTFLREYMRRHSLEEGSVIITDFQTAGRGQTGHSWESEEGSNLTFSVLLYPGHIPANQQFVISQLAAVSVRDTLLRHTPDITVKWPNDIYWKEKKICGMLIENDLCGKEIYCSILGIGININQEQFRSDAPNPVSLRQITGQTYDLRVELDAFLDILYRYYQQLLQGDTGEIRRRYRQALFRGEGFHTYADSEGTFEARIERIEPTGHLVLRRRNGACQRYAFKEVKNIL